MAKTSSHKSQGGEWSETCVGLWTHKVLGAPNKKTGNGRSTAVCTGINFIKIKVRMKNNVSGNNW